MLLKAAKLLKLPCYINEAVDAIDAVDVAEVVDYK